jgi:hypothetical protein
MRNILILAAVCAFFPCVALVFAKQPQQTNPITIANGQETFHTLTLKLYETRGNSKKILADPTIKAIDGKPFAFMAGGEIKDVSPSLEFGSCVNGTVEKVADNHLQVALKISIGDPIETNDPNIVVVKSRSVDVRMNVERSAAMSIQIDTDTWFDVRIG